MGDNGLMRGWLSALTPFVFVATASAQDAGAPDSCADERQADSEEISQWTPEYFASAAMGDVAGAVPERISFMKKRLAEVCTSLPPAKLAEYTAVLDSIDANVKRIVENERKCRADARCMAARAVRTREAAEEETFGAEVAKPLCEAAWNLDAAREAIRVEKANPSGVVDLVSLHQSGQAVQYAQAQITALTPKYMARRKHAFRGWTTENACLADYDEQMQQRGCTRLQLDGGMHRWECP
jgi:hypothetical protein